MKCIVVDDDALSCKVLESYIRKTGSVKLVGTFNDSTSARSALISNRDIELVFLDIEMPEMDGFDFIASLQQPPNIVIVSSKEQYALKAFDVDVADFLLKPVSYGRFARAVDKVIRYFARRESSDSTYDKEFFIKKGSTLVKLKFRDIVYVEALENYVTITTDQDRYTIHFTMKAIETQLPKGLFIRVHRSYIVNKTNILTIRDNNLDISVAGGEKVIPVGKSFRDTLLNDINVMAR